MSACLGVADLRARFSSSAVLVSLACAVVLIACAGEPAPAPDDIGAAVTDSATPGPQSEGDSVDAVYVDYTECVRAAGYPTFGTGGTPDGSPPGSIVLKDGTIWNPRDPMTGLTFPPAVLELLQEQERCSRESGVTQLVEGPGRAIAEENRRVRELHRCMVRRGWDIGPGLAEQSSVRGAGVVTRYPRIETASAGWSDEEWSAWLDDWGSCEVELYGASGVVQSPY